MEFAINFQITSKNRINTWETIDFNYRMFRFICEESEYVKEKASELTDDPTWIIDPIDGTYNFIHEFPLIAISVAMAYKKQVVIGIIYNPVTNHLFTSKRGEGAYLNGKRIYCSKVNKVRISPIVMNIRLKQLFIYTFN